MFGRGFELAMTWIGRGRYLLPARALGACERLLEMGAGDVIMPDLQKAGGLGEGQRIANLANLYYVPFAPHMVASFLGAMASCHVCARLSEPSAEIETTLPDEETPVTVTVGSL